ncbi:MAG: histidine--tRNA ligase [Deltaproteobacteria bacterium]|nr:histidine--tRNA ligase [Deltaproteobacteria bacterium]MCB9788178.1 histidine--tRNA ligase [Deltaproteobacteria bacterium]
MAQVEARVLKGFRDYLPEADIPRQAMLRKVVAVFESFGFGPLTTPALEYADILLGKYGEEGDQLLYRFADNGGRDVALRYDLTVPLARVVAQHRSLDMPFRRYQVAPVWRAEKPGRGRFREFLQCDVDIVGEASARADAECMMVGLEVLGALGVPGFVMRVNNRKILDGLLDRVGVEGRERRHAVLRVMDKLPKIGRAGVEAELSDEVGLDAEARSLLFEVLGRPVAGSAGVRALDDAVGGSEAGRLGITELAELLDIVEAAGYGDRVEVDLSIARGLDYYTGTIYETFVRDREGFGSVMSGGRYDTLLAMFLRESIPAVGISLGIDRLVSLLVDLGLVGGRAGTADVFAAAFDDEGYGAMVRWAGALRRAGVGVETSLVAGRLGKQFRLAEKKGYRFVVLQGPDERAADKLALKDLQSGEQVTVDLEEVVRRVRSAPDGGHG